VYRPTNVSGEHGYSTFTNPEDGGSMLIQNVGIHPQQYTAQQPTNVVLFVHLAGSGLSRREDVFTFNLLFQKFYKFVLSMRFENIILQ
jgi:hypothetical protein